MLPLLFMKVPSSGPSYPRWFKDKKFIWLPKVINGKRYAMEFHYTVTMIDFEPTGEGDYDTTYTIRKSEYEKGSAETIWRLYNKIGNLLKDK